ncbi:MAG: discoidin domain-containing protein [Anaerolineae bacterium]|nr:discoidin domain-containing protein [Anaerolineae bacterium]
MTRLCQHGLDAQPTADPGYPNRCWTTPTYYLKQQFSKFIQLEAVRIYSNVGPSLLRNVAFLNPDRTVVLIVVNRSTDPQTFRVRTGSKQFIATIPGKVVASYKWHAGNIPCPQINLAEGQAVVVSSTENSTNIGANVLDGDPDTRWASQWDDDQWIYVDLGSRHIIDRVVLDWEDAFGQEYDLEISDDLSTWTTMSHQDSGFVGINIHDLQGTGRYIQMKGITRGTEWGYSLYEFQVYDPDGCVYLPITMRQ